MSGIDRWPYLHLLAGRVFYLGEPEDFQEIDRLDLDRTEAQLGAWIAEIAGGLEADALKNRIQVATHHRILEPPDEQGRQPLLDYVFLFDHAEMLVEEAWSYPSDPGGTQPARLRRFRRQRYTDCPDEIKGLFTAP